MKNSIVIPLGSSNIDHLDLRYALRSIEKNVKNVKNIVIVGDAPPWIKNVDVIGCEDDPDPKWKENNILRKIQVACLSSLVTKDFFFANDDHFILSEIDASNYPYYYGTTWTQSWINNKSNYRKTANHTRRWLEMRGFPDNNFDCHCPIIYNKEKFLNSFNKIDFLTPWGYGIKTLYCATNRIDGVHMPDVKIRKKHTLREIEMICDGRHVVSCTDAPLKAGLGEYLHNMFPKKSIFEQ